MSDRFLLAGGTRNWDVNANWDDAGSGGAGGDSFPVAADVAILESGSGNLNINVAVACTTFAATEYGSGRTISGTGNMTLSGAFIAPAFAGVTVTWTGAIIHQPAGTPSTARAAWLDLYTFASYTLNATSGTNGCRFGCQLSGHNVVTLTGALTITQGVFTPDAGSSAAILTINCASVSSNGSNTRTIRFAHSTTSTPGTTFNLTGTGAVWDMGAGTNLTIALGTIDDLYDPLNSKIIIADTSAATKSFIGGSKSYGTIEIVGSAGAVDFQGDNTILAFTSGATPLVFTGTTTTFTGDVTLTDCLSITGGAWVKTSGTVTAPAGCVITNNAASGGATFDGSAAFDGGGNSGWTGLQPLPPVAGGFSLANVVGFSDAEGDVNETDI